VLRVKNMYDRTENRLPGRIRRFPAASGYFRLTGALVNGLKTPISPEV
jgi:hypothetical protein